MELRCDWKKHAILILEKGLVEVSCDSQLCGRRKGVVVLHRFSVSTGELVETKRYREPPINRREETSANYDNRATVRHP